MAWRGTGTIQGALSMLGSSAANMSTVSPLVIMADS